MLQSKTRRGKDNMNSKNEILDKSPSSMTDRRVPLEIVLQ